MSGAGEKTMPILIVTPGQHVTLTGLNAATLRSDRARNLTAAAFGAREPLLIGRPLMMDVVSTCVVDKLARDGVPKKIAADTTRGYFDYWMTSVALVEHKGEDRVFVVSELDKRKTGGRDWHAAEGPKDALPKLVADLQATGALRRMHVVDIAEIIREIRKRADDALIDLSLGSFFLPVEHRLFIAWREEFRQWRVQAFARHSAVARRFDKSQIAAIEAETSRARQ
jgi:hypothetical protein